MQHAGRMVVRGIAGFALTLRTPSRRVSGLTDVRAMSRISRALASLSSGILERSGNGCEGEAGRAAIRAGVPAAASVSARTMMRLASSIFEEIVAGGLRVGQRRLRRAAESGDIGTCASQGPFR